MSFRKVVIDASICLGLLCNLLLNTDIASWISYFVFYLVYIVTVISAISVLILISTPEHKRCDVLTKDNVKKCKKLSFKMYEPLSDLAISLCLSVIGHPVVAAVYFVQGMILRSCEYEMVKYYDNLESKNNA